MARGKKTVATMVGIAAVVMYYITIPVPPNLSSSDYFTLRMGAFFITDMCSLLRLLPTKAHIHWFNFIGGLGAVIKPSDPAVRYTDMDIDSEVKIRLYEPVKIKQKRGGLVYFHGGGWFNGNIKTHHTVTHHLAAQLDIVVISVDYRLAWQDPFPAAINDCTKATIWFMHHAEEYNVDPTRIAVAGDSAGGNLAAAVAGRLTFNKEYEGLPKLKFQGLIYPALQFIDFNTPSYQQNGDMSSLLLTKKNMVFYSSNYLIGNSNLVKPMLMNNHTSSEAKTKFARFLSLIPTKFKNSDYVPLRTEEDRDGDKKIEKVLFDPDAAPLMRENLQGLPPAYIITAEHDVLRDDGIMYAHRLKDAGVQVTWRHYENGIHVMFSLFGDPFSLNSGKQCMKEFIEFAQINI